MIKLQLLARLGKDAEVSQAPDGTEVARFSVAANPPGKDADPQWVNCSWWRPNAKTLPYLTKGKMVYVEGVPKFEIYNGKVSVGISVKQIELLGGGTETGAAKTNTEQSW